MGREPSTNGDNGRDAQGRFAKGNPGGPGNPFARRVAALRGMILDAVSEDDLRAVVAAIVKQAKAGDVAAARELFNRLVGKPDACTDPDRLDLDEMALASEARNARESKALADALGSLVWQS